MSGAMGPALAGRKIGSELGIPASVKTLDEVIAYATDNNVAMYTVGLGNVDGCVRNRLASETVGQFILLQMTINSPLFTRQSLIFFSANTR